MMMFEGKQYNTVKALRRAVRKYNKQFVYRQYKVNKNGEIVKLNKQYNNFRNEMNKDMLILSLPLVVLLGILIVGITM